MEYTISVFKDKNRIPEIIDLFATGLGKTTEEYWKWRIFTPNGQEQPEAIVVEDESGRLVGVSSVLPEIYGDKERKCAQLCDWVIYPDYRGQGLVGKLYRYAYERYIGFGYDFMIEYPNDNSYPIFQKYGFTEKENVGSWNTSKRLLAVNRPVESQTRNGVEYRFTDTCPVIQFRQRADRMYRIPEFMSWKYDQNPTLRFRWLSVWEGMRLIGYFVYTCTKGRLRTAVNIYDWEFEGSATDEFRVAIGLLNRQGNYVSIWGRYGEVEQKLLHGGGLDPAPAGTRLMLKALSNKGWPEPLTLTRLDTDY